MIFKPEPIPDAARLLTFAQVGAMLQVSERTVWTMVHVTKTFKKIPVGRQVRIDRQDVEDYISRAKEGAA